MSQTPEQENQTALNQTTQRRRWTAEQAEVLAVVGSGLAVTAGAGAGKTTTLVEKCLRLLTSRPEARLCAVSFTERSAGDLRDQLARAFRGVAGFDLSRHWITTIHGLCGAILREFPAAAGLQGDERILSERDSRTLWSQAVESLWTHRDSLNEEGAPSVQDCDSLPSALQRLLSRESRGGTEALLARFRDLEASGLVESTLAGNDQDLDPDLRAAAVIAAQVLKRFEALKKKNAGIDFADLEKGALRALQHESVRVALQKRFDLVLVDEFQDTNLVQARILSSVVQPDWSNLCVVGDPKQSIYRFRDADVRLFEESCARLPERRSLTWNFRSHPEILNWVNQICTPLFASSSLTYEALTPGRQAEDFALAEDEKPVLRLDVEGPEGFADWIVRERDRGVPLHSMAVLMRRVRGMEAWIQALSRRGIPVAVGGGGLFWQDPRVLELLAMLQWWAFPVDEWAAGAFLRAPWVQVSLSQMDLWKRECGTFEAFWRSSHPVALALARFHGKAVRPGELLAALLADPGWAPESEEMAQSLLALWMKCEQLSYQGSDFLEVVRTLSESAEQGRREKEVPPPANRGVLSVMTIHASKGLEFDRVYLIDFKKRARIGVSPILYADREKGVFLVPRDEAGERDERNPQYREWKAFEQGAQVSESKRQFYVALTRAKAQLVFVCVNLDPEKGWIQDRDQALLADDWRGWLEHLGSGLPRVMVSSQARQTQVEPLVNASSSDELSLPSERKSMPAVAGGWIRARHSVSEWTVLARCPRSFARLQRDRISVGGDESLDLAIDKMLDGAIDSEIDSEMDRADGFATAHEVPGDLAAALEGDRGAFTPVSNRSGLSSADLGKRVHTILETAFEDPVAIEQLDSLEHEVGSDRFSSSSVRRWLSSRTGGIQGFSELPFEWKLQGALLVGVIDRVEEREPGVWVIEDFKVSRKLKSDEEILSLYGAQIEIYAAALRMILQDKATQITGSLVQISPQGVVQTSVPLNFEQVMSRVSGWAEEAEQIVAEVGAGAHLQSIQARSGIQCRSCGHRTDCDQSRF